MNIIKTLSALLRQNNMDAVLITDNVALAYVTGMSNIEGTAFITKDEKAFCFTDSRYIEAAQNIVPSRGFAVSTVEGNNYFKHISTDMWFSQIQNIVRCAELNKAFKNVPDTLIVCTCLELTVGKCSRSTFPKLDIGGGVKLPCFPEMSYIQIALLYRSATFNYNAWHACFS